MMMNIKSLFVLAFLSIGTVFIAEPVIAQNISLYSEQDIFVETIPLVPGANEQVTVTVDSYSFNLNNYYIAWYEDGNQTLAGYGEREYSFRTKNQGEVSEITAVIEVADQTFRKELRFSPSEIDLLWEAVDGTQPPFYRGKSLPAREADIEVTAIPDTGLINPTDAPNLVYYWENDYNRDTRASGFGRQSYRYTAETLKEEQRISVTANDRRENSFAENSVLIETGMVEPDILFYEIDNNERLLTQKDIGTFVDLGKDTIRMAFYPLHLSNQAPNFTDLFVQWSINNEEREPQDFARQNELFISSGGERGNIPISVELENIDKILQSVSRSINVLFS